MSRFTIPATLMALLLATASFAAPKDKIMEIKVDANLTAVADATAGERITKVSKDIQAALAAKLADRIADKGIRIDIEITQLQLDPNSGGADAGKSILAGKVHFNDDTDNRKIRAFGLEVSQGPVVATVPVAPATDSDDQIFTVALAVVSPDLAYQSLVDGFADAVIAHLND